MRLLTVGNMYPPEHLGGYEAVWASVVDHLRSAGHDVTVLTTDTRVRAGAPAPEATHIRRELRWTWRDHAFQPLGPRAAFAIERANRRVLADHLAARPDVVLWWSMGGLSLGLLASPAAAGIPSGAIVHDAWPVYGPRVDPWLAAPGVLRAAGRLAGLPGRFPAGTIGAWSFNSGWLRDGVLARVGQIDPGRCEVAHPGIDADRFAGAPAGDWGWRLLCVGRVESRKGLAVAVSALAHWPEQARLTIVGGGDEVHFAELRALAAGLGVGARVEFTGPLGAAGVAAAYAAADAILFPVTWDEPFGLVPLEAMAAGRPVVATGTGGSAEYLDDGGNALVVAPGDVAALASAVDRLAADAALRSRLTAAGLATARAHPQSDFNAAMEEFARALSAGGRGPRADR